MPTRWDGCRPQSDPSQVAVPLSIPILAHVYSTAVIVGSETSACPIPNAACVSTF